MRTIWKFLLLALLGIPLLAGAADKSPFDDDLVGDWGDWDRLVFEGNRTFSADAIRGALIANSEYLLTAHPQAPLAPLVEVLQRKLTLAYQAAGFPDVTVAAKLEEAKKQVRVSIVEGPRFKSGEIQVTGAKIIPVETLVWRLTHTNPPPDAAALLRGTGALANRLPVVSAHMGLSGSTDPAASQKFLNSEGKQVEPEPPSWTKGEPVAFDPGAMRGMTMVVTNILADLGFFFPRVNVSLLRKAAQHTADLQIEIADEGPQVTLGNVAFSGLKRNAEADLRALLELRPGLPVSHQLISLIELRLWRSARFIRYRVRPDFSHLAENRVDLKIDLEEGPDVQPLGQTLNATNQAWMNWIDWFSTYPSRDEDLVLDVDLYGAPPFENVRMQSIISPRQGALWLARATNGPAQSSLKYAVISARDRFAIYSPRWQEKYLQPRPRFQLTANISILPNEPEAPGPYHISLTSGLKTQSESSLAPPFQLEVLVAPAVILNMSPTNRTVNLSQGILNYVSEQLTMKIDAASGRLIDAGYTFSNTEDWAVSRTRVRVHFEKGAFARTVKEIDGFTARHRNVYNARQPINSAAGFVVEDAFRSGLLEDLPLTKGVFAQGLTPLKRMAAAAAVHRLFVGQPLAPLDDMLNGGPAKNDEVLMVPIYSWELENGAGRNNASAMLSAFMFKLANDIFPKRSWPLAVAREVVFVYSGQGRYTEQELQRLYTSGTVGPVGMLTIAKLLSVVKSPASQTFAGLGLTALSLESLHKDTRLLFREESPLQRAVMNYLGGFRTFKAEDGDALAAMFVPDTADTIRKGWRILQDRRDQPQEVAQTLMDELWESSLKTRFRGEFRNLLAPPESPPSDK